MKEEDVEAVFQAVVIHGLRMRIALLSDREQESQKHLIRMMLEDNDAVDLISAIKHGMPEVWPFNEGRAFDASDLRTNLLKAKAEAEGRRKDGTVPFRLRHVGGQE